MRKSTVVHPVTREAMERLWTLPLLIVVCRECGFPAIAMSAEASELAIWDHVAAVHLGGQDRAEVS